MGNNTNANNIKSLFFQTIAMKKTTTTQTTNANTFKATKEVSDYTLTISNGQVLIKWVSARHDKEGKLQNNFYCYQFAKGITLETVSKFLATTSADYISKEITDRFIEKGIAQKIVKSEIDEALQQEMEANA